MSQLALGKLSIPSARCTAVMVSSSDTNPGASIVAQPILPGIFQREEVECLPIRMALKDHSTGLI